MQGRLNGKKSAFPQMPQTLIKIQSLLLIKHNYKLKM